MLISAALAFSCLILPTVQAYKQLYVSVNYSLACTSSPFSFTVTLTEPDVEYDDIANESKVSLSNIYNGQLQGFVIDDWNSPPYDFIFIIAHNCGGKDKTMMRNLRPCYDSIKCEYSEGMQLQ